MKLFGESMWNSQILLVDPKLHFSLNKLFEFFFYSCNVYICDGDIYSHMISYRSMCKIRFRTWLPNFLCSFDSSPSPCLCPHSSCHIPLYWESVSLSKPSSNFKKSFKEKNQSVRDLFFFPPNIEVSSQNYTYWRPKMSNVFSHVNSRFKVWYFTILEGQKQNF